MSRCYAEAERPLHLCLRSGFDHISDTSAKCDHVPVHLSDCCSTNLDDLQKITEKYSQNRKGKRTEVSKKPDEREIKVEHKTPEIIHKDLIGSPIHLKRLLMNILSNAVKYNKDYGKIYLSSREIPSDQDGVVMLEFICQDTGIGMSEEFQKHLFEPFAQEQKGGASKFGGTGLGMPIDMKLLVKIIAELAGKIKIVRIKDE